MATKTTKKAAAKKPAAKKAAPKAAAKKTAPKAAAKTKAAPKAQAAPKAKAGYRIEHDLLGNIQVPNSALYGVQTLRGINNFHISNVPMNRFPSFIVGFAYTKWGAILANHKLGLVTTKQKDACAGQRVQPGDPQSPAGQEHLDLY